MKLCGQHPGCGGFVHDRIQFMCVWRGEPPHCVKYGSTGRDCYIKNKRTSTAVATLAGAVNATSTAAATSADTATTSNITTTTTLTTTTAVATTIPATTTAVASTIAAATKTKTAATTTTAGVDSTNTTTTAAVVTASVGTGSVGTKNATGSNATTTPGAVTTTKQKKKNKQLTTESTPAGTGTSASTEEKKGLDMTPIYIGGGAFVLIALGVICFCCWRRRRGNRQATYTSGGLYSYGGKGKQSHTFPCAGAVRTASFTVA